MAFTVSRTRICPIIARVESAYGTPPTMTAADYGLLAYDSAAPVSVDITRIELRPHGASFTHRKDIIAQRLAKLRFRCALMGSGSIGSTAVAGYRGLDALLQGCGLTSTATPATSIVYAPSAVSDLKSVSIYVNMDGVAHKLSGCYGTLSMSGDPRNGNMIDFEFTGLYQAPIGGTDVTTAFSGWAGGDNRALGWLGLTSSTIDNTADQYVSVLKSYRFALNATIEPIDDANSTTGMYGLVYADRAPTLNVTVGLDTQGDATDIIQYPEFFADCFAGTTHDITWTQGSDAGNVVTQLFNDAQLVNLTPQGTGAHRSLSLDYKCQNATDDSEFTFTIT